MSHTIEQVRNLALTGHNGAGKTTLAEALIFNTGQLTRIGRIEDGTTISDYDSEEVARKMSVKTSLLTGEWNNYHFDVMDTPGYADFIPETLSALRVADGSVVVIDAIAGIDVGTERVWRYASELRLPRLLYVNKMDREAVDVTDLLEQIQARFGREAVAIQHPLDPGPGFHQVVDLVEMKLITYVDGKAEVGNIPEGMVEEASTLHEHLVEAVAETDEELMQTYFGAGGLDAEALMVGLRKAVLSRQLFPVLFGDAYNNVAVDRLLQGVADLFPSPAESPGLGFADADGNEQQLVAAADAPLAGFVFKTVGEQHVGELSYMRLYAGTLRHGDEVHNVTRHRAERIGQIFEINGHERQEVDSASAGDIVALVKLKDTHTGNTISAKGAHLQFPPVVFPEPLIRVAVTPREKGGEERMVSGLQQLREEDPSFEFRFDGEIRQSVLAAQGDLHLETILKRLRDRFHAEVDTQSPRIPYRETIRGRAEGTYRHKKQSGGRGQFAEVSLRVEPRERGAGFEFRNEVVGGSIPTNFIPAVEKGLQETLHRGPICNAQVVDLAATVHDGKYHAVDSDEVSFRIAASHAFREAFIKASPALLEPICHVRITVPEEFLGEVMGDLTSRRGRISGTSADGHFQVIEADVPLAEMDRYATRLRSMSQGKGMHTQELARYEEVPADVQSRISERVASEKAHAA
ncbi:MAG: elongation factor G [bacterium]|nr:elongation factor G [bacterium]